MATNSEQTEQAEQKIRHILALSGGKDSSALAVHMLGKVENMEYVFCDTGEELDETYEYISKLEDYLCEKIVRLKSDKDFQYYLDLYNGVLPDARTRWCTRMLKLKPYEAYVGDDPVRSYVGIRADEPHRKGYISTKPNITTVFPFIEDNIRRDDVERILKEAGLGLPRYYDWRSRSGCYFCFYQQKNEWTGLREHHRDLFDKAKSFEKYDPETGERYSWNQDLSLDELDDEEKVAEIREEHAKRKAREARAFKGHQKLKDVWGDDDLPGGEESICTMCHL